MENIKVKSTEIEMVAKAEFICEFISQKHWIDKAYSWIGGAKAKGITLICLDTNGNLCFQGEDFRIAQEKELYPVRVFRLIRTAKA
jgi:hypothetical protein